jgi:hypothetical protein
VTALTDADLAALRALAERDFELDLISGVEGLCAALNSYRIAGPKPWGGGTVTHRWRTTGRDVLTALGIDVLALLAEAEAARRYREALEACFGLLSEMHPHVGCDADPCRLLTDLCLAREQARAALAAPGASQEGAE